MFNILVRLTRTVKGCYILFDKKLFSSRVRFLRNQKGISQSELAVAVGATSKAFICDIERETRTTTLEKAVALADFFNVSLDYLVGRSDDPAKH